LVAEMRALSESRAVNSLAWVVMPDHVSIGYFSWRPLCRCPRS
jgi:hypothetical protein